LAAVSFFLTHIFGATFGAVMMEYRYFKKQIIGTALVLCTMALGACNIENINDVLKFDMTSESVSAENLIERDVEAPDVFQVSEAGLWDGRPSLGGVWVAHPDVKMPERVIIYNGRNDTSVIGALFRRELESAGPSFQVSSEAATALGLTAGFPVNLTVTAIRKRMVKPNQISNTNAPSKNNSNSAKMSANVPTSKTSEKLKKPFIQLGIFTIEKNAINTGINMRRIGIIPMIKEQKLEEKKFWRVIVGPVRSQQERKTLLKTIISAGFKDAYAVTH
jgi:cell division septation protein DedD